MRKLTALCLGLTLVFSLSGCQSSRQTQTAAAAETTTAAGSTAAETAAAETNAAAGAVTTAAEADDAGGKALVVYYSATGSTKAVAETIAEAAGADLFELEPVEPYSSEDLNWTNSSSRVSREHDNEDERDVELVTASTDNWDGYDTVLIGYPIWWGIAAWPVNEFVETNDFTGKTVIPFCTSSSSGLGESGELLAEMAGTGDWQEGIRFRSSVSADDVRAWVDDLGLTNE